MGRKVLPWQPKRRVSDKKALEEKLKRALLLIKQNKSDDDIAFELNPQAPISRQQVYNYKKELIKRGLLERDETSGRVIVPKKVQTAEKWSRMEQDPFLQIPEIRRTWEVMKDKNKGRGITNMKTIINQILTVCNTLNVAPKDLLLGFYGHDREMEKNPEAEPNHLISLTYAMNDFRRHMDNKTIIRIQDGVDSDEDTSILAYVLSMRQLYACNDKPVPKSYGGKGHILSGAKENFGAYNHVQLSDKAKLRGIKFFKEKYGIEYAMFFAFMFEMMPRTTAMFDWVVSFKFESKMLDNVNCHYAKTRIYESKTDKWWNKTIYDPAVLELAKLAPQGKQIITTETRNIFERRFGKAMREFYVQEKMLPETILLPRKDPRHPKYKKTTTEYYLLTHSAYVLRHSGAHMWMRRSNYNGVLVANKGWETVDILTKAYAGMPDDYELEAGTCYYCDPPQNRDTENYVFCSPRHSLIYLQNGHIPKGMMGNALQKAIADAESKTGMKTTVMEELEISPIEPFEEKSASQINISEKMAKDEQIPDIEEPVIIPAILNAEINSEITFADNIEGMKL
jgi:hypothetical protein